MGKLGAMEGWCGRRGGRVDGWASGEAAETGRAWGTDGWAHARAGQEGARVDAGRAWWPMHARRLGELGARGEHG